MVRHKQFKNGIGISGAARYFTEHLAVLDYYSKAVGLLQGRTFDHVGLSKREMDYTVFSALERNVHPETGERLTPRTNGERWEQSVNAKTGLPEWKRVDNHRTGLDLPFVVPKTLSEVMAMNPGELSESIERVCVAAKDRAMTFAESLAKTRVRVGGADHDRVTGNLLYLSVIHRDARPVGSKVADPYWHSHTFIFNQTFDPVEKKLKAVQLADVLKYAETIDALFLSEVERGLTRLGIGTERTADGRSFEITSVLGKEIFCKRRNEILREEFKNQERIETLVKAEIRRASLAGKTLDYDKVKTDIRNRIGKQLAQKKVVVSLEDQMEALRDQMTPEIRASLQEESVKNGPRRNWRTVDQAKEEVLFSAFKQKSVVHEFEIVEKLLRATGGSMRFEEAMDYARSSAFVRLDREGHLTTESVRQEEFRMLKTLREGWGIYKPMVPGHQIKSARVAAAVDQAAAVEFILNSPDAVMDVSGIAGGGKTTLLQEVVPALRKAGYTVVLLAPTSASETNLKKELPEAMTLQRFETDLDFQRDLPANTVIFLDESSMVSIPQGIRLQDAANAKKARIVTLGDWKQHHSVERGDWIRVALGLKAVNSVKLVETYRANNEFLRETVKVLKAGRKEEGFDRLDAHGDIIVIDDPAELRAAAVEKHLEAARGGDISLLVCPVHSESRETAALVRQTLKDEGKIDKQDHAVIRIQRLDAEGIELRDPLHYQKDRVVCFHSKVEGGFRAGEKWKVLEAKNGAFHVSREGVIRTFDPRSKGKWNVCEPSEMLLSVGDQVRLTNGFKDRGVAFKNNEIVRIAGIDDQQVTLADGRKMRRDFLHLDQGICITSYASECLGVNQMIGIAPLTALPGMDAKSFYVMTSRASDRAIFYTDLKEALKDAVMRDGDRTAVTDYQLKPEKELPKSMETPKIAMHTQAHNLVQRAIDGIKRAARKQKGPDRTIER